MPRMDTHRMQTVEETQSFAKEFVEGLVPHKNHATVVCLYGDLGSGKTTFVQKAAEALGVKEVVTSPTFVIQKTYNTKHPTFKKLFHIDAYRLKGVADLQALSFEATVHDPHNIFFIEWPSCVADALPENKYNLTFTFVDEHTRDIATT